MPDPIFGSEAILSGDPSVAGLNLQPLLDRLGVRAKIRHIYEPLVLPVAIVDAGGITITAITGSQPLGTPFTAGETIAPAANTRLADTGSQNGGQYNATIMMQAPPDGNAFYRIRRRNNTDASDIWLQRIALQSLGQFLWTARIILGQSERLVIEIANAGTAALVYQASIWLQGPF